MSKQTASADGGAMPADPRLRAIRDSIERTLGEMDSLIDAFEAPDLPVVADKADLPDVIRAVIATGRYDGFFEVAVMLDEARNLIVAGQHDAAEAKLAEAKAMLAAVKIEGGAQ
jgi:hypothetical protein